MNTVTILIIDLEAFPIFWDYFYKYGYQWKPDRTYYKPPRNYNAIYLWSSNDIGFGNYNPLSPNETLINAIIDLRSN